MQAELEQAIVINILDILTEKNLKEKFRIKECVGVWDFDFNIDLTSYMYVTKESIQAVLSTFEFNQELKVNFAKRFGKTFMISNPVIRDVLRLKKMAKIFFSIQIDILRSIHGFDVDKCQYTEDHFVEIGVNADICNNFINEVINDVNAEINIYMDFLRRIYSYWKKHIIYIPIGITEEVFDDYIGPINYTFYDILHPVPMVQMEAKISKKDHFKSTVINDLIINKINHEIDDDSRCKLKYKNYSIFGILMTLENYGVCIKCNINKDC